MTVSLVLLVEFSPGVAVYLAYRMSVWEACVTNVSFTCCILSQFTLLVVLMKSSKYVHVEV